jgi:hypothetical protein
MERQEMYAALFSQLVAMLHFAAMQQMGKIKNPMTEAIERNLEGARHTIDTIDMLQARTRGNLSPEEDQFLRHMLQELKLNYVDEVAKGDTPSANGDASATPADGGGAS